MSVFTDHPSPIISKPFLKHDENDVLKVLYNSCFFHAFSSGSPFCSSLHSLNASPSTSLQKMFTVLLKTGTSSEKMLKSIFLDLLCEYFMLALLKKNYFYVLSRTLSLRKTNFLYSGYCWRKLNKLHSNRSKKKYRVHLKQQYAGLVKSVRRPGLVGSNIMHYLWKWFGLVGG